MFEKNTKQVNDMMAKMFAAGTVFIILMVILSWLGIFEFGASYTWIVFIAGIAISLSPSVLIHILPDNVMKYYMLVILAVFIGVLGTNNHIGIYITYALVPVLSCLYFDPKLIIKISLFSYVVMACSLYVNSAYKFEVTHMDYTRFYIFMAYLLGFTIEYIIVNTILYYIMIRAKQMMEERYCAEEENQRKSAFLSNMSHDIRTPMNAILGFAALARTHVSEPEIVADYLNKIQISGDHLLNLINDVLNMSRIENGKLKIDEQSCNITQMVYDVKNMLQADLESKQLTLSIDLIDITDDTIICDKLRLNQILINILGNAIKFTDPGGKISLRVAQRKMLMQDYSEYRFVIRDNGIGMSPEFAEHIFEPFSREQTSTVSGIPGTGLGMAITKNLVDMMHGDISVSSAVGEGSEFVLTFRFAKGVASTERTADEMSADRSITEIMKKRFQGRHILLVDDVALNREIAQAILEEAQIQVETARNGEEALQKLEDAQPGYFDLVLMDIMMPVMDGHEATRRIRRLKDPRVANIPIVAMTANAFEEDRAAALDAGMDEHLAKPFQIEDLYCAMQRAIR